ncbi:MAG: V-type ATP synthase subunit A [Brevinema sp.]
MNIIGIITRINGPLISITVTNKLKVMETVHVSELKLIGEVLSVDKDTAVIQVYETTDGLKLGDNVYGTGSMLFVELGPGLLANVFDGIQRPLKDIAKATNSIYLERGVSVSALDRQKKWEFTPTITVGEQISFCGILGTVPETELILHKIMTPPNIAGVVRSIVPAGQYTIDDVIAVVEDNKGVLHELKLVHRWPVKIPRPYKTRYLPTEPLVTGQRVIDVFFPVAKGGAVAIPGGFGTGKTITQHQLAKWSNANIVIYIGCGERGNEITEVIEEFPKLIDPHTGHSLFAKTVMIANTSNMPVTAREASIYTGITIAEYYRDMGYDIAVMADSSSRWAEALRELSGRLEEIPAEEGFPAYLGSRLASFYERAGKVETINQNTGSVTMIAAVSPPGGDFSEPVTQNTKRFVRAFWELDKSLASARHYPSINWIHSYSEYSAYVSNWWEKYKSEFVKMRQEAIDILLKNDKLQKIVKLIGPDALPGNERLIVETARMLIDGFLKQNAYDAVDMYASPEKQILMLRIILTFYKSASEVIALGAPIFEIRALDSIAMILRARFEIPNDKLDELEKAESFMKDELQHLQLKYQTLAEGQ